MKVHFGNNLFIKLKICSGAWVMTFFFAYAEEKPPFSMLYFYLPGAGLEIAVLDQLLLLKTEGNQNSFMITAKSCDGFREIIVRKFTQTDFFFFLVKWSIILI